MINEDEERRKHGKYPGTAIAEYSGNIMQAKSESKDGVKSPKLLINLHTNSQTLKSDHNKAAQFRRAKPKLNLKPVPEIVKPTSESTTIRPNIFLRRPEITKSQPFAKQSKNIKKQNSLHKKMKIKSWVNTFKTSWNELSSTRLRQLDCNCMLSWVSKWLLIYFTFISGRLHLKHL